MINQFENLSLWQKFSYRVRVHLCLKKWFDTLILIIIILNCVFIAMEDPREAKNNPNSNLVKTLNTAETIFTILFTIEMVIKMIGFGLSGKFDKWGNRLAERDPDEVAYENAQKRALTDGDDDDADGSTEDSSHNNGNYVGYFNDTWNKLDFIIVVAGYVIIFGDGNSVASIRILRVLRPLRTFNKLKSVKCIVETILTSMKEGLMEILWLLLFLFTIYAIVSMQLFKGALRNRCYYDRNPYVTWPDDPNMNSASALVNNAIYLKMGEAEEERNPPKPCEERAVRDIRQWFDTSPDVNGRKIDDYDWYNVGFAHADFIIENDRCAGFFNNSLTAKELIGCCPFSKNSTTYEAYEIANIDDYYVDFQYFHGPDEEQFFCTLPVNPQRGGVGVCPPHAPICAPLAKNPDSQLTSFDNFGAALLNVFIVITLEGWVDILYKLEDAVSPYSWLFFVPLTVTTAFFAINLCLAVIEEVYSDQIADEDNVVTDMMFTEEEEAKMKAMFDAMGDDEIGLGGVGANIEMTEQKAEPAGTTVQLGAVPENDDLDPNIRRAETSPVMPANPRANFKRTLTASRTGSRKNSASIDVNQRNKEQRSTQFIEKHVGAGNTDIGIKPVLKDGEKEKRKKQKQHYKMALHGLIEAVEPINPYLEGKPSWVKKCNYIVCSAPFLNIVMIVIFLNTLVLALEYRDQDQSFRDLLSQVNIAFTIFFTLEMIAKLLGLGVTGYLSDSWNVFDGIIVIVSLTELVLEIANGGGESGGGVSALRGFRLMRVFRVLGQFEDLRILLGCVSSSLSEVSALVMILLVFIFMFATLGISCFSLAWEEKEKIAAENGDDFPQGRWEFKAIYFTMITMFQVITSDAWNTVMYDARYATREVSVLFFVAAVICGGFVVLTMFVAILLSRMSNEKTDKWDLEFCKDLSAVMHKLPDMSMEEKLQILMRKLEKREFRKQVNDEMTIWKSHRNKHEILGTSLFLFTPVSKLRIIIHNIVKNKYFEAAIDIIILINCAVLAIESPAIHAKHADKFKVAELTFTGIFIIEMLLKMIGMGMFKTVIFADIMWTTMFDVTNESLLEQQKIVEDNTDVPYLELIVHWEEKCVMRVFDLVKAGDLETLKKLPPKLWRDARGDDHISIAHMAAGDGSVEFLEFINGNHSSTLESTMEGGLKVPHIAARNDQLGIVEWLVQNRSGWADESGDTEETLVHEALRHGSIRTRDALPELQAIANTDMTLFPPPNASKLIRDEWWTNPSFISQEIKDEAVQWSKENHDHLTYLFEAGTIVSKDEYVSGRTVENPRTHPGKVTKIRTTNDGNFLLIEYWSILKIRFLFDTSGNKPTNPAEIQDSQFITAYILTPNDNDKIERERVLLGKQKKEIWMRSHFDREIPRAVEQVCRSYDMTDRNHNAYMASNWNRLDCFVVAVSIAGLFFTEFSVLRALRAIRPLRITVRIEQIKVVVASLIRALPEVVYALIFCFLLWFVWGILGVTSFSAQFDECHCDEENMEFGSVVHATPASLATGGKDLVLETLDDCKLAETESHKYIEQCEHVYLYFNFDNIIQAIHTLAILATMSGWNDIMYKGVDVNGLTDEDVPRLGIMFNKKFLAMYFVIAIILCAFFSINLIVSVVVDQFLRIKDERDGSAFMTKEQQDFVRMVRMTNRIGLDADPKPKKNPMRKMSYHIVQHPLFEPFIMFLILSNTLAMAMEHWNQSAPQVATLKILDWIFCVSFLIEAILKIAAYGWLDYIHLAWNKFDFFIVIIGFVGLSEVFTGGLGLNVLRLLRVFRVIRLVNKAQTLKTLFLTLFYALPSIWNIGLLVVIIFFIYAVIGMHIFGSADPGQIQVADDKINFDNFTNAFALLFRICTGDAWSDFYNGYLEDDTKPKYSVYIFFLSFFVIGGLILINLFIASILETFGENKDEIDREKELKSVFIWRDVWKQRNPNSPINEKIEVEQFFEILMRTPHPAGLVAPKKMEDGENQENTVERSTSTFSIGSRGDNFPRADHWGDDDDKRDEEILRHLLGFKLLIAKNKNGIYEVNYNDALLAIVSNILGTKTDVDRKKDHILIVDWFADFEDPKQEVKEKRRIKLDKLLKLNKHDVEQSVSEG